MTREEEADKDLRHTRFSPGTPLLLCVALLLILVSVPFIQGIADLSHDHPTPASSSETPSPTSTPTSIFPNEETTQAYEKRLEDNSVVRKAVLPRIQTALTADAGMGNSQVSIGKDGWLFYRNDLNYITSTPFMAYDQSTVDEIVSVNEQLKAAGIRLIVAPIPPKPSIYPEKISKRPIDTQQILHNPSYVPFLAKLQEKGVVVFDTTPVLESAKRQATASLWLTTDTHWSPLGMEYVAVALADFIQKTVPLPSTRQTIYTERSLPESFPGDLINLLGLSKDESLFPKESVDVRHVYTSDGQPLKVDPTADVLIIGDSLSEYYSGSSGSLTERLSFHLQRPLDRISDPSRGLRSMNVALEELTKNPARLKGKRLIIWEFNDRTLCEHWDPITLPLDTHTPNGAL